MATLLPTIVAGAAALAAQPIEPSTWFNSKDHPKTALAVAERGHIAYTIDVAPDGAAIRCETVGTTELDRKVCEVVMKRARFQSARDEEGRPAFGLHEGVANFLLPGKSHGRPDRAKLTIPVGELPAGITGAAYGRVVFMVSHSGVIGHCASTAGERRRSFQVVEALGPAACEAIARTYRPTVARNAAGEPVESVQSVMVRFEPRPAS